MHAKSIISYADRKQVALVLVSSNQISTQKLQEK
jgi:hypothetical protein